MATFPLAKDSFNLTIVSHFEINTDREEAIKGIYHNIDYILSRPIPPKHSPHNPALYKTDKMADEDQLSIYDEIEIEDMTFDPNLQIYTYPCPCGDRFEIAIDSLRDGEDIAVCPSCSLMIRVIFDVVSHFPQERGF